MRVLLIECDTGLRTMIERRLRDVGHHVAAAWDDDAAVRILERGPLPDVIVLDLSMPRMIGQFFRMRQLAEPRYARIPTLVIAPNRGEPFLDEHPDLTRTFSVTALIAAVANVATR